MKWFLALPVLLASAPASADTVYLIIKSEGYGKDNSVALLKVPMNSIEQCEEQGAILLSSKRFDTKYLERDGFECIQGK